MSMETTLSSLAMLKVRVDQGGDYLEYLRPFILHVLPSTKGKAVTDESVSISLLDEFGLSIPRRTTQILLQRLTKRGGPLKKQNNTFVLEGDLPSDDLTSRRTEASRKISAVAQALLCFAKDNHDKDLSEDEAFEALTLFLSKFSVSCIRSYLRGTALPDNITAKDGNLLLVCEFVKKLNLTSPERFEDFILLVQGHMLANALLCPDLQSVGKTYAGVSFFLDTPILLQAIGLEGEVRQQAVQEMIRLLQSLSGQVGYFSHTFAELKFVIKKTAEFIDSPQGVGAIIDEARKLGKTKSDLILEAENSKDSLDKLNLIPKNTPPYIEKYQIDESIFGDTLDDSVSYKNPKAKQNDINSVRSIYVLREGAAPHSIETSKAVFVTSNSGFAKAAYEYGKNIEQTKEVSPVISDFSLANTAWLKAPQGAPSLPRKEVVAFSYAALRPNKDFLQKMLAEADKLEKQGKISERSHQMLRSNHSIQEDLLSHTLGEDDALTERSITTVLQRAENEIKKEETAKLLQAQAERALTESDLQCERVKMQEIERRLYWDCDKRARRLSNIPAVILALIVVAGLLFGTLTFPQNSILGMISISISLIFGGLTACNLIWGTSVRKLKYKIYLKVRVSLLRKESKRLGLDLEEKAGDDQ